MKYADFWRPESRLVVIGALLTTSVALGGPSFGGLGGMRKKTLDLKTRQPALVRLSNTSIAFKNAFTNPEYAPVVMSLATALGTELVSNEKTLIEKEKPQDATWVLQLIVTGYAVGQPTQHTETTGNTSATYVHWTGSLNAAYQVIDKTGRVHDASNMSANYNKEFPVGTTSPNNKWAIPGLGTRHVNRNEPVPNSQEDVKQILIHDVVEQIATKLGNTTKPVEVQIATGDPHLDRAAEFLEQQLWSRALDELEKTPAFPKPDQEAYRQYDLGLAYEAISYSSASPNDQKENIFKAAEYYDKALEMNTKEKYFVATVARTRDALARYKELEKQDQVLAKSPPAESTSPVSEAASVTPAKSAPSPASKPVQPTETAGKLLTVNDVIEMYNAKVASDDIIGVINSSTVEFNPHDKDTLIAIAKANLPLKLQNALRAKVGAPLVKPAVAQRAAPAKSE